MICAVYLLHLIAINNASNRGTNTAAYLGHFNGIFLLFFLHLKSCCNFYRILSAFMWSTVFTTLLRGFIVFLNQYMTGQAIPQRCTFSLNQALHNMVEDFLRSNKWLGSISIFKAYSFIYNCDFCFPFINV